MVRGSAASEGRDQAGNQRYKHASKQREEGDSPDHPHSSGSRAAGSQCGERGKTPRHHLLTQFPAISSHCESPRGVTVVAAPRAATPVPTGRNYDRVLRDTPRVMKGVFIDVGFALPRDAGPHRENWPEVGVPVPAGHSSRGGTCRDGSHAGVWRLALSLPGGQRCRSEGPHREDWPAFPHGVNGGPAPLSQGGSCI